ncbi:MAG: AI-2E family transporter, partial [Actinomycetota bacterium]|nr:AI-2E family transporter [Actinomycetota bacterium]
MGDHLPEGHRSVPSALDNVAAWSWRFLLVSAALAVAAFMLIRLRVVVLPVILALLLTSLLEPPARWLKE